MGGAKGDAAVQERPAEARLFCSQALANVPSRLPRVFGHVQSLPQLRGRAARQVCFLFRRDTDLLD